jgi:hypothetical protein
VVVDPVDEIVVVGGVVDVGLVIVGNPKSLKGIVYIS